MGASLPTADAVNVDSGGSGAEAGMYTSLSSFVGEDREERFLNSLLTCESAVTPLFGDLNAAGV